MGKPESEQTGEIVHTEDNKAGSPNIDQIRNILFGTQMLDYDRKISNLEQMLLEEVTQIKEITKARFDSIESVLNKEIDLLSDKLNSEKENRDKSIEQLFTELNNTANAVHIKLDELENNAELENREIRQSIVELTKTLHTEISHQHERSMVELDRSLSELNSEKINRSSLSVLLTDLAKRLTGDSINKKNDH